MANRCVCDCLNKKIEIATWEGKFSVYITPVENAAIFEAIYSLTFSSEKFRLFYFKYQPNVSTAAQPMQVPAFGLLNFHVNFFMWYAMTAISQ